MRTLLDALKEKYPGPVEEWMQMHPLYGYSVHGPVSIDDEASITVILKTPEGRDDFELLLYLEERLGIL